MSRTRSGGSPISPVILDHQVGAAGDRRHAGPAAVGEERVGRLQAAWGTRMAARRRSASTRSARRRKSRRIRSSSQRPMHDAGSAAPTISASVTSWSSSACEKLSRSLGHVATPPFGGQGDRLDDLRVAGAAAEVAGDRLADRSRRSAPPRTSRNASPAISIPGVQIPHCAPPVSRNACWSVPRLLLAAARPSTVRTDAPRPGRRARGTHRRPRRRGARVHAPHSPFAAALLRAGQPEVLAEHVEQAPHARSPRPRRARR